MIQSRSKLRLIFLVACLLIVCVTAGCFEQREVTRGGVIRDIAFIIGGEIIIIGIFYFALFHFLLKTRFHHFAAHSICIALTGLYSLCLITLMLLPYRLLNTTQWFFLFLILGVAWLFLSIMLITTSNR